MLKWTMQRQAGAQNQGPGGNSGRLSSVKETIFVKGQKYGWKSGLEMCSCSRSPRSPFCDALWEGSTDSGPAGQVGCPLSPDCSRPTTPPHAPEFRRLGAVWQFIKDEHRQREYLSSSVISCLSQQWLVHIPIRWNCGKVAFKLDPDRGHTWRAHSFFFFFLFGNHGFKILFHVLSHHF